MSIFKKKEENAKKGPQVRRDPRNFTMDPVDVELYWGIIFFPALALSIYMIVALINGTLENVNMVLVWIVLLLGGSALGYIFTKEYRFIIKNRKITRCCFMMKDRTINFTDVRYYSLKEKSNPRANVLYLYYSYNGRMNRMKIAASYTNYDLMEEVIKSNKWKRRERI